MSRETTFQFRVSTEERELIRQYAAAAKMKDSEYARERVLGGFDPNALTEDEEVSMTLFRPVPDAAATVGPNDPLLARTQEERDQEALAQAEDFKALVAKHRQKTSLPNAERLAKKELGYE